MTSGLDVALQFLISFPFFMLAVVIHEVSHGWMAYVCGDPTARQAGRLTLNPFRHIDPMGTLFLPLILILMRAPFVFGWAKPVPVNASLMRRPKRDMIWVGAAGPAANFALAAAALGIVRLTAPPLWVVGLAEYLVFLNLILGVFNLLPIPPLDGSRVLVGLLPSRWGRWIVALEPWGMGILLLLIWLGILKKVTFPVVDFLFRWMIGLP